MNSDTASALRQAFCTTPEPTISYPVELPVAMFRQIERFAAQRMETVQEFLRSSIEADIQACFDNEAARIPAGTVLVLNRRAS